jgi:D-alanyl-D-alanine carboxypeptidase
MNDSNNTSDQHTQLPIVAQFAVLVLILGGIFGMLYFNNVLEAKQESRLSNEQNLSSFDTAHTVTAQKLEDVAITADAAFVFDVKEQRVLYAKNESRALPLASITKLMTALLAHELVAGDTEAIISDAALSQDGDNGLMRGQSFTAGELERFALIASSNDAAFALGASVGELLGSGNPNEQFVKAMNIRAEELKLETLSFKNTTGLDISTVEPGAVGSAKDVTFLMEHIVEKYPEIVDSTREGYARVFSEDGTYYDIENTNEYVSKIPNIIGSKTGYTDLAGGNLVVAFDIGLNRPIIVTVLGSTRAARFTDVMELVEAVQNNIR